MEKSTNRGEKYWFWKWVGIFFVMGFVVVGLSIACKDCIQVNLNEAQVGIISILLTLPVTAAAAYVVIILGARMNDIAAREHRRELYLICKEEYQNARKPLIQLDVAINRIESFLDGKLLEMLIQPLMESALPEGDREELNFDIAREYDQRVDEIKEFNELTGENYPIPSPQAHWESSMQCSMVSGVARSIDEECSRLRDSLKTAMSEVVESGLIFYNNRTNYELITFAFSEVIYKIKVELDEQLKDMQEVNEEYKKLVEPRKEWIEEQLSFVDPLLDEMPREGTFIDAIQFYQLLLNLCSRPLFITQQKKCINQILVDYVAGMRDKARTLSDRSELKARTLSALKPIVIFPVPLKKSVEICHTSDGVEEIEFNDFSDDANRIGMLFIEDLRRSWPSRKSIIDDLTQWIHKEDMPDIYQMLIDSMPSTLTNEKSKYDVAEKKLKGTAKNSQ